MLLHTVSIEPVAEEGSGRKDLPDHSVELRREQWCAEGQEGTGEGEGVSVAVPNRTSSWIEIGRERQHLHVVLLSRCLLQLLCCRQSVCVCVSDLSTPRDSGIAWTRGEE